MSKYPPAISKQLKTGKPKNSNSSGATSLFNRVSEKAIIDFTRSLAVMIRARVPLVQALDTNIELVDNQKLEGILRKVRKDVSGGTSLARSLATHGKVFDDFYIHLVRVGEAAGILDEVLLRLSSYKEKRYALKKKIQSALMYPALVVTVALCALVFLLLFVIPNFADMYSDFNAKLPAATQFVLNLSHGLSHYFFVIVAGVSLLVFGFRKYAQSPNGRRRIDALKIRLPYFGDLYLKTLIVRFCQTLGTLLKSGITLVESLEILKKSSGNVVIEKATDDMVSSVKKGKSIKDTFNQSRIFPPMVVQMVTVGEETAELDEMMLHIAKLYDEEVDVAIQSFTSVIEPALIVVLGILLGGIIVSMYLPIFQLMNVIH
ncbi:MAG TPA: type II secretion system F family protein [Balneolales bacterium]|nr:type II secretion system F family protein [Balneolales bacterium]